MLSNARRDLVMLDISWDEVAKYIVQNHIALNAWTSLIEKHLDRFLFGTDSVVPTDWNGYTKIREIYQLLSEQLKVEIRAQIQRLNYERFSTPPYIA